MRTADERYDGLLSLCAHMLSLLEENCNEPHEKHHGKPCETCAEDGSLDCPLILRRKLREICDSEPSDDLI